MVKATLLGKEPGSVGVIQLFSPSIWNFGSADNPRDLDDFLDDFRHFEGPEPWLRKISKVEWSNFFLVCPANMEKLSKRARELLILYCLSIVERYAQRLKTNPTLARIQDLMTKDYQEEYDNAVYHFKLVLRDKVINQAVMRALANRFPAKA
jgi:hypothetical protein